MDQLGIVWWSEGVQLWCFHKWQMNEQQFVITAVFLSILNLDLLKMHLPLQPARQPRQCAHPLHYVHAQSYKTSCV